AGSGLAPLASVGYVRAALASELRRARLRSRRAGAVVAGRSLMRARKLRDRPRRPLLCPAVLSALAGGSRRRRGAHNQRLWSPSADVDLPRECDRRYSGGIAADRQPKRRARNCRRARAKAVAASAAI